DLRAVCGDAVAERAALAAVDPAGADHLPGSDAAARAHLPARAAVPQPAALARLRTACRGAEPLRAPLLRPGRARRAAHPPGGERRAGGGAMGRAAAPGLRLHAVLPGPGVPGAHRRPVQYLVLLLAGQGAASAGV